MKAAKNLRIMMLVEVEMANPNGDATTGAPRRAPDGRGMISSPCLKNKIRQALFRHDESVLHYENGDKRSIKEKVAYLWSDEEKKYDVAKINREFIDTRLFGATDLKDNLQVKVKGAITVGEVASIDPVKIIPMSINRSYIIDKDSDGNEVSKGFDNGKPIVMYGLYPVYIGVNYYAAKENMISDEDIDKFIYAVKTMFMDDYSASRPAGSINIRQMIVVRWDGRAEDGVLDTSIKDTVMQGIKRKREMISNYYDYEFDYSCFETEEFAHVDVKVLEGNDLRI